jgi:hypothetical protein
MIYCSNKWLRGIQTTIITHNIVVVAIYCHVIIYSLKCTNITNHKTKMESIQALNDNIQKLNDDISGLKRKIGEYESEISESKQKIQKIQNDERKELCRKYKECEQKEEKQVIYQNLLDEFIAKLQQWVDNRAREKKQVIIRKGIKFYNIYIKPANTAEPENWILDILILTGDIHDNKNHKNPVVNLFEEFDMKRITRLHYVCQYTH